MSAVNINLVILPKSAFRFVMYICLIDQTVTEDPREDGMSRETHEALISDGNLRKSGSAWEKEKDHR